jgi:hypothetical protein
MNSPLHNICKSTENNPKTNAFEVVYTMSHRSYLVGFEVLTAVSTKMAVLWVVAPCSLVEVYQRFRGPCCLHQQGDES